MISNAGIAHVVENVRGDLLTCSVCSNEMPLWPSKSDWQMSLPARVPALFSKQSMTEVERIVLLNRLEKWCREIPHISDTRFPSQATAVDSSVVPTFWFHIHAYSEKREPRRATRQLHGGEETRAPSIVETPDAWAVTCAGYPFGGHFTTTSDVLKETVDIPDTGSYELCQQCDENGQIACKACVGTGRVTCIRCSGTTRHSCPPCRGSGQIKGHNIVNEFGTCRVCGGSGMKGAFAKSLAQELNRTLACEKCHGRGMCTQSVDRSYKEPCGICKSGGQVPCGECNRSGKVSCEKCKTTGRVSCHACGAKRHIYTWWVIDRELKEVTKGGGPFWQKAEIELPNARDVIAQAWASAASKPATVWQYESVDLDEVLTQGTASLPHFLHDSLRGECTAVTRSKPDDSRMVWHRVCVESLGFGTLTYAYDGSENFTIWLCGDTCSIGRLPTPLHFRAVERLKEAIQQWGDGASCLQESEKKAVTRVVRVSKDIGKRDDWFRKALASVNIPQDLENLANQDAWAVFARAGINKTVDTVRSATSVVGAWIGGLLSKKKKS